MDGRIFVVLVCVAALLFYSTCNCQMPAYWPGPSGGSSQSRCAIHSQILKPSDRFLPAAGFEVAETIEIPVLATLASPVVSNEDHVYILAYIGSWSNFTYNILEYDDLGKLFTITELTSFAGKPRSFDMWISPYHLPVTLYL